MDSSPATSVHASRPYVRTSGDKMLDRAVLSFFLAWALVLFHVLSRVLSGEANPMLLLATTIIQGCLWLRGWSAVLHGWNNAASGAEKAVCCALLLLTSFPFFLQVLFALYDPASD